MNGYDITDGLTEEEKHRLDMLLIDKTFAAGETLMREGEPCLGLMILRNGAVSITKLDMGGHEQTLTRLEPPSILGELELLTGDVTGATVTAIGSTEVAILPTDIFEGLIEQRDAGAIRLLRNLGRALGSKLTATNELYVDMAIWGK